MKKLYAFEENNNTEDSNELLIDKVLEQAKQPKSPLSMTAQILDQRKELKEEITKKLGSDEEDAGSSTEDSEEPSADNETEDKDTNSNEEDDKDNDASEDKKKDDEGSSQEDNEKTSDSKDQDKDDLSKEASDKDDLAGIVGSGLSKEDKSDKDKTATECYKVSRNISNIFQPIKNEYSTYVASLETFCLESKAIRPEEQPIVYVKDSVIESLNGLVELAGNYISANEKFIKNISDSVKNLNERITIFKGFIDHGKYHFTNKLINDKDILANVSIPDNSSIRDTMKVMANYLDASNKSVSYFIGNEFSKLEDSFINSGFEKDNEDLAYKIVLPGFNVIRVHLEQYSNYLKTPIHNYQYYKLKTFKASDLFNLNSVGISEDKELLYVTESLDKLLVSITMSTDNLNDITSNFNKFIDEIKVIIFDINGGKYKDLTTIGIDNKVQDFVKFKLAIEAMYINIDLTIDYLTCIMSVLNLVLELKE